MIVNLPEGLKKLTNLKSLSLTSNHIKDITTITYLTNLEELHLGRNPLQKLPESLKNLANLKTLDLTDNWFTSLPEVILELTNLEKLFMGHSISNTGTKISSLPSNIGNGNLQKLTTLSLSNNNLKSLPIKESTNGEIVKHFPSLEILHLGVNPFPKKEKDRIINLKSKGYLPTSCNISF